MKVVRFDRSQVVNTTKTKEGFIKTDAVVTRTGIFIYYNADGTIRRELRDHREVFNSDSLDTMKMIPMTNDHPQTETRLLTPANVKQFQVGFTGENVRADGENVRIPVTITDEATINAVESGKKGLSLGYECDLIDEQGDYEGMRFDYKQSNIRYNHLAIVHSPRAGENARLDSADIDIDVEDKNKSQSKKEAVMPKVRIDGCEYEASQEVINFLTKETTRADSAENLVKTEKSAHDKTKADLDSQTARADGLDKEKANIPVVIAAAVADRIALERKAVVVLDEKGAEGIDKLSDVDIKKKIILAVFPEAKLDEVSTDYLNARVDSAIEMKDKIVRADAMADQREKSAPKLDSKGGDEDGAEGAEKRYAAGVKNAWKTKADGCGSKEKDDKNAGSIQRK